MSDDIHVMPENDWKEHTSSINCWCHPTRSVDEDKAIIHNSLDGREVQELRDEIAV